MKRLTPILLVLALAPCVAASPATASRVATELATGKRTPESALAALRAGDVSAKQAIQLLGNVKRAKVKSGRSTFELKDEHGRASHVRMIVPKSPRADGRYGVLIVLHGLGGNANQLLAFGQGLAPKGTIVIAPNAQRLDPKLEAEDIPRFGSRAILKHWWRYHAQGFPLQALRYVKRHYPLDTDRVLLVGYSMGGYGAWGTGLRFPHTFAAIAPMAGGISRLENILPRDKGCRVLLENAVGLPSFFVHGDKDRVVPVRFSRTIHEDLLAHGAEHIYEEVAGGPHILRGFLGGDERTQRLKTWLAAKKRNAWPKTLRHVALGTYHGRRGWLRIDGIKGKNAKVQATVKGNKITLTGDRVEALTLFLSPKLVDMKQPVRVVWKNRVLFVGEVEPSLDAVIESWRNVEDPALLAPAMLKLEPSRRAEF
jgi:predicted esterase